MQIFPEIWAAHLNVSEEKSRAVFVRRGESFYEFVLERKNHTFHVTNCAAKGGRLIHLKSQHQKNIIVKLIEAYRQNSRYEDSSMAWMGSE